MNPNKERRSLHFIFFFLNTDCLDKRNVMDLNYVMVSKTSEIVQVMLEKMGIITRMSRILDKRNIPVAYAECGRTMENTGGNHQGSDLGLCFAGFF